MPTRPLPSNPSLGHLKSQATQLQRAVRAGEPEATALVQELHPRTLQIDLAAFSRADALLVVARRYGFATWPRLRRHLETVARYARSPHAQAVGGLLRDHDDRVDELLRLACLTYGQDDPGRWAEARTLLAAHPELAGATIHTMAAVGDVAAARALLAERPAEARRSGGPYRWEPLLYLTYARLGTDQPGRSPVGVARLLLDHGADPNAGYLWEGLPSPFTALTGVFGGGEGDQPPHPDDLALARLLLDAGADPSDSQTLYNRQFRPADDHLELLFAYGLGRGPGGPWHQRLAPALESPTELVERQLGWAAYRNMPERVDLLLANGVDPDGPATGYPLGDARRAREVALLQGHTAIAERLAAAGAGEPRFDPVESCAAACMAADRAGLDRLRARHPDLVERTRAARPELLREAADNGHTEAVRLMAELDWDVNHGAGTDATALHWAAFRGRLDTVQLLVELGADLTVRDSRHDATPQGWAEHGHQDQVAAYLRPRT